MDAPATRIGIVGCGGFARFAAQQFVAAGPAEVTALCEPNPEAERLTRALFDAPNEADAAALAARDDVDLVYIATPPALHYPQAKAALLAGKHVICEKPLTVTTAQADELIALAAERDRLLVANLMQRYNPLFDVVRDVLASGLLGDVLHGLFENYASDEQLGPDHWFWDAELSGGIFIEHGVHFFDLFAGWLGPGEVVAAQASRRSGGQEDQVLCTVRYGDEAHVNFYHGFTQPGRVDRQLFRILCERGEISLYEWVPTRLELRALATDDGVRDLCALIPGAKTTTLARYDGDERNVAGRHKAFVADQQVLLAVGDAADKMTRYAEILQAMFRDQLAWIADRGHARKVTERNGRDSVALAEAATALARGA